MQLLIVVVRYNTPIEESETVVSLSEVFRVQPELSGPFGVLMWDNSSVKLRSPRLPFPFEYRYSDENVGVSGAYNYALAYAESIGCPWLLLLDQDTSVPIDYLQRMLDYTLELQDDHRIATIVPFVRSHGALVSPRRFGKLVRHHQIPSSVSGIYTEAAYAINSGTVMRISALREVGGYSDQFWLDQSDVYIFHALHRSGKVMYIAGDFELPHSIANMDYDRQMTPERYRNFLAAENAYIELYRSRSVNWVQTLWLLARAARQYRRFRNKKYAKLTLACFFERLIHSKSTRMKRWQDELQRREIPVISDGRVVG